jgi:hypothetical protein
VISSDVTVLQPTFEILKQLHGFLSLDAFSLFCNIASVSQQAGVPVLEIGVYCGRSLAALACAFDTVPIVGVDPFYESFHNSPAYDDEADYLEFSSSELSPEQRKNEFWKVVGHLEERLNTNFRSRISLREVTQDDYFQQDLGRVKFQALHIDGEHTFSAVKACLDVLNELLMPNSWLIVDDVLNSGFPDISEAVHTHVGHRTDFWPVFFAFNKGVYMFRPESHECLATVKTELAARYTSPRYVVRRLHDDALEIHRRAIYQAAHTTGKMRSPKAVFKAVLRRVKSRKLLK